MAQRVFITRISYIFLILFIATQLFLKLQSILNLKHKNFNQYYNNNKIKQWHNSCKIEVMEKAFTTGIFFHFNNSELIIIDKPYVVIAAIPLNKLVLLICVLVKKAVRIVLIFS